MTKTEYMVTYPDGVEVIYSVGKSFSDGIKIKDIVEPDPRNTGGACFLVITFENGKILSIKNTSYVVSIFEE